jgi:hypothetical protein
MRPLANRRQPRTRTLYGQSGKRAAQVYRDAAALMEREGYKNVSDADFAIGIAADTLYSSYINRMLPRMAFFDFFGCWINNDEGILMLCFAACAAESGDLG